MKAGVLLAVLGLFSLQAQAQPLATASAGGITLTVYDDKCNVAGVSNLPFKATWQEKGQTFEGCWGLHPDFPVVMFYFSDKTVVIFPQQQFKPVTNV